MNVLFNCCTVTHGRGGVKTSAACAVRVLIQSLPLAPWTSAAWHVDPTAPSGRSPLATLPSGTNSSCFLAGKLQKQSSFSRVNRRYIEANINWETVVQVCGNEGGKKKREGMKNMKIPLLLRRSSFLFQFPSYNWSPKTKLHKNKRRDRMGGVWIWESGGEG